MASFDNHTFHYLLHILFFLLITIITQFPLASRCCHDEDRSALLNFKSSLDDSTNRLSSWQHENCCTWHGITCSNDSSSRVVSIHLRNTDLEDYYNKQSDITTADASDPPSTALTGKFPAASLIKLTHLEYLDLAFNNFQESQIPRQFTNLSSLWYLDLSCTSEYFSTSCLQTSSTKWVRGFVNLKVLRLSGIDIYEATSSSQENFGEHISHLSNIRELDLSYCNISSPVFPIHEFQNLSRLSSLKMNKNYQLNTLIPVEMANLTRLSVLELSECDLHGSIHYLPQLEELRVSGNRDLHVDLIRMFKNQWPKLRELWVSSTQVNGSIPNSISNAVPLLSSFSASSCSIQGPLPSSIYNLSQLQYLDLSRNSITGFLHPSVSNLKSLYFLALGSNNLQGSIPESICENFPLQLLRLDLNNLTGMIPSCISKKLQNLLIFGISINRMEGNVSLFSLITEKLIVLDMRFNSGLNIDIGYPPSPGLSLRYLRLGSCNLKGLFPISICNLTNLVELDLTENSLTGTIPSDCLFKLECLRKFRVEGNKPHGPVPLPRPGIKEFGVSNNKFSGEISNELGKRLFNADIISLAGNEFSGSIPSTLCPAEPGLSTSTAFIEMSNNTLSGTIPSNFGYCGNLLTLKLGNNNLTGKVPDKLRLAKYIEFLQLNNNHLDGTPLNLVSEFQKLEFLNLADNNFEGSIPAAFGSLQYLRFLSLRSNKFNGSIPEEIIHLQELQLLDLSLNNLSGHIPNRLGNLSGLIATKYLDYSMNYGDVQLDLVTKGMIIQMQKLNNYRSVIDLSCNNLEGNIPKEIALLILLSSLNLSHNHFSNDIPESIGNLSGLQSLDLSSNNFSGKIPQSLATIDTLAVLNLSSNKLSGKIPQGPHFDTMSVDGSAFSGNELLCGYPTNKLCDGDGDTSTLHANPANAFDEVEQEDAKEKLLFYAIVALGFLVGFWGLFLVLFLKKQKWWFPYWNIVDSIAVTIIGYI